MTVFFACSECDFAVEITAANENETLYCPTHPSATMESVVAPESEIV